MTASRKSTPNTIKPTTASLTFSSDLTHYSYFGSFRSPVSNVGPNAAFLDQNGNLTDIGSWYLGGVATGNTPGSSASTTSSGGGTTYSGKPYSAAGRTSVNAALIGAAAAAVSYVLV